MITPTPAAVTRPLVTIPKIAKNQFRYHVKLPLSGLRILSHMKQGMAKVTGMELRPPMRPARLVKKGNAIATKKTTRTYTDLVRSLMQGLHFLFHFPVYSCSIMSKTGMEKIWMELRQLNMTKRKVSERKPRAVPDNSAEWSEYRIPESSICTTETWKFTKEVYGANRLRNEQ